MLSDVVQITEEAIQMGMFPEAADYSFQNCRKEMLQMVTKSGGLLQTELNNNPKFRTMWKDNAKCSNTIPGGTPEHMAALNNYAEAGSKFYGKFTKLVQTSRGQDEFLSNLFSSCWQTPCNSYAKKSVAQCTLAQRRIYH